jgi:hypothetical protein
MVGKPFTMSEYDHPAPNDHAAELFPMLASFAAFQDWDGLYQFTFSSRNRDYDSGKIESYFELCCHPGKKAFLPIAALMFRMGAVQAGDRPWIATVPTDGLSTHLASDGAGFPSADLRIAALVRPVAFRLVDGAGPPQIPISEIPPGKRVSCTKEIEWDASDATAATYTVNAPAVRAAVGFIGGRELKLGNASIHVTKAEKDWASVAIGALDGRPLSESSKVLVVAAGRTENSNMGWNEDRTSVSRQWGDAPTVVEGISATIRLPAGDTITALDSTGKPTEELPARNVGEEIEFEIGPQYRTLWYGLTRSRRDKTPGAARASDEPESASSQAP